MVIHSFVTAMVLAGGLGLAACGEPAATTILNTEKVERAIERSSLAQRDKTVHVSCPSGVHQRKGLVFDCSAVSATGSTRFVVTQLDDTGRVHYKAP